MSEGNVKNAGNAGNAGLGTVGLADALVRFLSARFPELAVWRTYLGRDEPTTGARLAVVPESFALEPLSRSGRGGARFWRSVVCRLVLLKDFAASTTGEATFAPLAEVDPLIATLESIAAALTEAVVVDETGGATARLYAKETEPEPLYDETELLAGRFLGSVRVAISEKVERGAGVG
ncbi:MAG: hypothetical protein J6K20_06565 [Thermoguttaceae bacterium]|nr:hypothetical protein [Thermoguttaceae bacterium]